MKKLKTMPRLAKEIIITIISFVVLCPLSYFFLGELITISDQGLSTIGLALSASVGSLTAIVVSFVLIIWQFSRKERSDNFTRWRETLDQLDKFFVENIESLKGILPELSQLILASSRVSLWNPMPIEKITELFNEVEDKLQKEKWAQVGIYKQISNYLTPLLTAGLEHIISNNMSLRILNLRRLFYRLLAVLMAGVIVVALGNTATSLGISDVFNLPLVVILIAWFMYVLIYLGGEIKRISRLEDELEKRKEAMIAEWRSL